MYQRTGNRGSGLTQKQRSGADRLWEGAAAKTGDPVEGRVKVGIENRRKIER